MLSWSTGLFAILLFARVTNQQSREISLYNQLFNRIVGGETVIIDKFPYVASLQHKGAHFCGGTIISSKYILTAAHCTDKLPADILQVRVGTSDHRYGGESIQVSKIHQHARFNKRTDNYDISILELKKDITNGKAKSINIATRTPADGSVTTVIGWGRLWQNGPMPDKLQAVQVPIVNQKKCKSAYRPKPICNTMLCAGYLRVGGKDACQADSGGPLVVKGEVAGVVSFGYGCGDPRYPGVYANVAVLRSFIHSVTGL